MTTIADEIMAAVNKMTEAEQRRVLAMITQRDLPAGMPVEVLLDRARRINADPMMLDEVEAAIEDAFEQIDEDDIEPLD
ncbi:MAG: hypothetical protein KF716_05935 [Anaerolineae bacterium]|nr:hypothetical protein [Anaerolineae bacterium]